MKSYAVSITGSKDNSPGIINWQHFLNYYHNKNSKEEAVGCAVADFSKMFPNHDIKSITKMEIPDEKAAETDQAV